MDTRGQKTTEEGEASERDLEMREVLFMSRLLG